MWRISVSSAVVLVAVAALLLAGCAAFFEPDRATAYHARAIKAYERQEYAVALELVDSSLMLNDYSETAWANKALFETQLGLYEEALESYSNAVVRIEWVGYSRTMKMYRPVIGRIYKKRAELKEFTGDTLGARRDWRMAKKYGTVEKHWPWWMAKFPKVFGVSNPSE